MWGSMDWGHLRRQNYRLWGTRHTELIGLAIWEMRFFKFLGERGVRLMAMEMTIGLSSYDSRGESSMK